jgi:hypothetical protein
MMISDPQSEVLGHMIHFPNSGCNLFFTSSPSSMDYFYSPIFGNRELGYNCISCFTSLLGGIPLGYWNTSLFAYKGLSPQSFFSFVHPYKDKFTSTDLFPW